MIRIDLNRKWIFTKDEVKVDGPQETEISWEAVDLPHTWNAKDGQDGGNDYYRGTCWYGRTLEKNELPEASGYYLEFAGANASADVYINGQMAAHHDGGYSTWRVDMTPYLQEENLILVAVDNSPSNKVYPQMADFTFYGGLYRSVSLLAVEEAHFQLDHFGGPGVKITPVVDETKVEAELLKEGRTIAGTKEIRRADTRVYTEVYVTGAAEADQLVYRILEGDRVVDEKTEAASVTEMFLDIPGARLWNGRKDPYLYTLETRLVRGDKVLDERTISFGCRFFSIDPQKGFILNGASYPLRGAARHQDRPGIGNALGQHHHEEDVDLIMDMGATTVRLAHYQHDQYFYDLCDRAGLVVWAEIPYISRHMPEGKQNTMDQMRELVTQNFNHPSIVVWGLSNEISMSGVSDSLMENHRALNEMVHHMDPTRKTTVAVVSMTNMDDPYVHISDVVSYNHYYGWYGGDTTMNGPWFDEFHEKYPEKPIGISEYGAEALNWHTSEPFAGDYTEEYQAYYHEELIKQLYTREFIWATHAWNMFDFAADARDEGGEAGLNHKGLMTFDRQYKKDAFYAYKAWLSEDPFVHICSKRYVDRVESVSRITVYSNQPEVTLYRNGEKVATATAEDHFFRFDVTNEGTSELKAEVTLQDGTVLTDESTICKVDTFNESYRMRDSNAIINWFEVTTREGYLSINDRLSEVMKTTQGKLHLSVFVFKLAADLKKKEKAAAKAAEKEAKKEGAEGTALGTANGNAKGKKSAPAFNVSGLKIDKNMINMVSGFTILRLASMMKMIGMDANKEQLLELNKKLNKVKKAVE